MKQITLILLTLLFLACKTETQNSSSVSLKSEDSLKVENSQNTNTVKKVSIDFMKNKDLLDIILLLPDSAFSSWEWKSDARKKWYNEIKENNYYIDDNPDYFNQTYADPNKIGFVIVDGFWSINIYKTTENSYIVITNDVVGDDNSLNIYEVKSNIIRKYLDEKTMFSDFKEQIKKKENTETCKEIVEELNKPIFKFDFTNNKVEIEASWYLSKEQYQNCINGNAIVFNFNPTTKRFEIERIYWKEKEKE